MRVTVRLLATTLAITLASAVVALAPPETAARAQQSDATPDSAVARVDLEVRDSPSTQGAVVGHLSAGEQFTVTAVDAGEEVLAGNVTWFRTPGGYVYSGYTSPRGGQPLQVNSPDRYITVDRSAQVLRAYENDQVVYVALVTVGVPAFPTPVGYFQVLRRVFNETMDSRTIGIPLSSPNGYYLTGVLYTQYITPDGVALHYNYWSPPAAFGNYPGSHGCIGLQLADAEFLWYFATIGTPVIITL